MIAPRFPLALALAAFTVLACSGASDAQDKPGAAAAPTATSAAPGAPGTAVDAAVQAAIRKALAERIPRMPPIDEIRPAPIAGLYEVRYGGTELLYADASGDHIVVNGSIIETRTRTDLTEQRMEKLLAIDFAQLPLKDAIVIKQGSGTRKLAVFVDPNCGYCKRFERDLASVKDLTVYTFLMPILGPDSTVKSRAIWCAKDGARAWRSWMLDGVAPEAPKGQCDFAGVERNLEFGRKHRINGTPALVFEDGTRKPGAIPAEMLEKLLAQASRKS
ncbi:MAG: DsbC family protein [Rubrivivax sp.]|nr:DsbC family protein [Rubrivivax sp.]